MRLKSTIKHRYELHLRIDELNNIPQLNGSAYCKLTISKHNKTTKFQDYSQHVDIKNNKSHFKYELVKSFSIYQDLKKNSLLELNLRLEFFSLLEHHKTKLGSVKINLVDFLKYTKFQTARYLLQDSKINSILKISIFWVPINALVTPTSPIPHPTLLLSSSSSPPSQLQHQSTYNQQQQQQQQQQLLVDTVEDIESPVQNGAIDMLEFGTKLTHNTSTCLGIGSLVISDERILLIIDKSFEIPWCDDYEEFTPLECVDDIFDNNGPGFKRNDEGQLLVELYSAKRPDQDSMVRHSTLSDLMKDGRRGRSGGNGLIDDRLLLALSSSSSSSSSSSRSDDDGVDEDADLPHGINLGARKLVKGGGGNKYRGKSRRYSQQQVTEKEVRPDLKSWIIR